MKNQVKGVSTFIRKEIKGTDAMANFSGASLAMVLGLISPKIKITNAITMVAAMAPCSFIMEMKRTVATAVAPIFTRLFPTNTVESNLS